ncbi:HNH endonuclease family protein [Sorangium sp. So ce145]|uniref:HNH endonuclease family protein n=1 Tax=Sorangium sp. So ce145 TaxID=3133285 RepID=UPI003F5E885F
MLGWTTKSYNRIFLNLARVLRTAGTSSEILRVTLSGLSGESSAWPTDAQFSEAWLSGNAYELTSPKVVHILRRVGEEHLTNLSERITIDSPLTVEHIMPQNWLEKWTLPSGEKGLSGTELWEAKPDDSKAVATKRRNDLVQTFGNLTLVTQALNSTVSNSAWITKRPALMSASLLPINQQLHEHVTWDEEAIQKRGKDLLNKALKLWLGPSL